MTIFTPGISEGIWCTINANFLSQVVGLSVSGALLVSIPLQLRKLTGPEYQIPERPRVPENAVTQSDAVARATTYRRCRAAAYVAGVFTYLFCIGAFGAWIWINLIVAGNTKCADLYGKFASNAGPNLVFAFVLLILLAALARFLGWLAARNLPEKS